MLKEKKATSIIDSEEKETQNKQVAVEANEKTPKVIFNSPDGIVIIGDL